MNVLMLTQCGDNTNDSKDDRSEGDEDHHDDVDDGGGDDDDDDDGDDDVDDDDDDDDDDRDGAGDADECVRKSMSPDFCLHDVAL